MANLGKVRFRTIVAWAEDTAGTGFSLVFDADLKFMAIINTNKDESYTPVAADFTGQWQRWKPQEITVSKSGPIATISVEDIDDPLAPPSTTTVEDGQGWNSEEEPSFTNNWMFDRNRHVASAMAGNITINIAGPIVSGAKYVWRVTYNSGTLTLPSEFKRRSSSVDPGALTPSLNYILEAIGYDFSGTEVVLYEIVQV